MTLVEKRSRFDASRGSLRSYLLGTARHLLLRRFQHDQKFSAFSDGQSDAMPAQPTPNSDDRRLPSVQPADLVRSQNIERVRQAVLSLPADYREAVVLCELQEFRYDEAAAILGCPIGTVRSRLHRARTMLAEKLREVAEPARRIQTARSTP